MISEAATIQVRAWVDGASRVRDPRLVPIVLGVLESRRQIPSP